MLRWINAKVIAPIFEAVKNGLSIKKLAVSLALGISIGLIPLYGLSTLIVTFVAFALRLDFVVMQAVHYAVHPIQIALFVPFFKAGNHIFATTAGEITFKSFVLQFKSDFWGAAMEFWKANLSAILVWVIVAIPLSYILYITFLYVFKRYFPVPVRRRVGRA